MSIGTSTYYYVCDSCAHVQPWPADVDEMPSGCENCGNWFLTGPIAGAGGGGPEEISQVRIDSRPVR